jgi:TonB family protein
MIRTRRLPLFACALLAMQACASSGGVPHPAVGGAAGPFERGCRVAASPARLPAAGELVEVEAFRAAAATLWAAAGRPAGHVLFSIRHSADGTQVRRAVIESTVPVALADTLRQLVFADRRQAPAAEGEWGVRLRVDLAEPVALSVARREQCGPRPRDWEYRTAGNRFDVRDAGGPDVANPLLTDPQVAWVHVWLDERGTVTDARVERSAGGHAAEQRLLNYVRAMAFIPATEDGFPVPGELTLPVRLSMVS